MHPFCKNLQGKPEKLDRLRGPQAADESLAEPDEGLAVALHRADQDHDEVGVGEHLGGVADSVVHLLGPVDLLEGGADHLDGQELEELVADVEGEVEDDVPHGRGQLVLATAYTGYCLAAPRLKERRFEAIYGDRFRAYRAHVPYWLPRLSRRPEDA